MTALYHMRVVYYSIAEYISSDDADKQRHHHFINYEGLAKLHPSQLIILQRSRGRPGSLAGKFLTM
jgi:hypothetical protein